MCAEAIALAPHPQITDVYWWEALPRRHQSHWPSRDVLILRMELTHYDILISSRSRSNSAALFSRCERIAIMSGTCT